MKRICVKKLGIMLKKVFTFLTILFLIKILPQISYPIVFAETDEASTDIVSTAISIIVIISIVVVLLYLGGILKFEKKHRSELNWIPLLIYVILIIVIFILPVIQRLGLINIFPDDPDEILTRKEFEGFKQVRLRKEICYVFKYLNISEVVACYLPALIYFFLLPFAAIFVIVWSFMKQIKVFENVGKPLEGLIAFIITFMTLPMGTFNLLIALWFSVTGVFSVAVFVAMLLVGIFSRGLSFVEKEYYRFAKSIKEDFNKKINEMVKITIEGIERSTSVDEIVDNLLFFMKKTGITIDSAKIKEIKSKDVASAKQLAVEVLKQIVSTVVG